MTAIATKAAAQTRATAGQLYATITNGARSADTVAPTLPTPKIPSAVPCFSFGYHRET